MATSIPPTKSEPPTTTTTTDPFSFPPAITMSSSSSTTTEPTIMTPDYCTDPENIFIWTGTGLSHTTSGYVFGFRSMQHFGPIYVETGTGPEATGTQEFPTATNSIDEEGNVITEELEVGSQITSTSTPLTRNAAACWTGEDGVKFKHTECPLGYTTACVTTDMSRGTEYPERKLVSHAICCPSATGFNFYCSDFAPSGVTHPLQYQTLESNSDSSSTGVAVPSQNPRVENLQCVATFYNSAQPNHVGPPMVATLANQNIDIAWTDRQTVKRYVTATVELGNQDVIGADPIVADLCMADMWCTEARGSVEALGTDARWPVVMGFTLVLGIVMAMVLVWGHLPVLMRLRSVRKSREGRERERERRVENEGVEL